LASWSLGELLAASRFTKFDSSFQEIHEIGFTTKLQCSNGTKARLPERSESGVSALIFDCDGVLADTERDGHLAAYNQTFAEFGLPLCWTEAEYAVKRNIGGGKERLASVLTPNFIHQAALPTDPQSQRKLVSRLHHRKTQIFIALVADGQIPARPGVARIACEALDRGWKLAVASTSACRSVHSVLRSVVGGELATAFAVFAGDVVPRKKPAPDIYLYTLKQLAMSAENALVIEHSRIGLLAATAAGLRCIVTPSAFTTDERMDEALLVVTSLGDPAGEHSNIVANRARLYIDDHVRIADLARCLSHGRTQPFVNVSPVRSVPIA
jgi:HAD superfamily hydrolase (TIGR01509 family)